MRLAEVMTRDVAVVPPSANLREAARLMDQLNVGVLPVCEGRRVVGMITDRDITVRASAAGRPMERTAVSEIMTEDVHWCYEDEPVEAAEQRMAAVQIRRVPVLDRNRVLVGIVSLGDIATDRAARTEETLRRISEPSEPDRSATPGMARARQNLGGQPRYAPPAGGAAWVEMQQDHRGRGPRGYSRSDERIREDVNEALTDDPVLDATNVEVSVKDAEVTLNGTVGSRYDKRRAEDAADSASGVRHVQNNLRIVEPRMAELAVRSATTDAPNLTER